MRRAWGLPLLTKELLEQSARRRTFVIRTLYATLLFFFALLIFYFSVYQQYTSPLDILGRGRQVFDNVTKLQFAGVFLFMPAITCSLITAEKERNTFGLLLLTRLGPWTILVEKLLSRLVPMISFLLLSLPLMGFAYAMGGVGQREVWVAIWSLLLTATQVGALSIACSAFFRTTVQSFIAIYFLGFAMYFGWGFLAEMSDPFKALHYFWSDAYVAYVNQVLYLVWPLAGETPEFALAYDDQLILPFFAPVLLMSQWGQPDWYAIPLSIPTIVSIVGLLVLARVFVVRRAFVPARNLLLKVFRQLDYAFQQMNNNRVTKGIVLIRESSRLPDNDPIAWRETQKRSLGMIRYLIRFWVVTEIPTLLLCCGVASSDAASFSSGGSDPVSALSFLLWLMAALLLTVKSATLIAGERSHETLDVLLSTPIRSAEIVRQKFRGVWRLILVLACPLITIVAFQTYFRIDLYSMSVSTWVAGQYREMTNWERHPAVYLLATVPTILIYLPMLAWIGFAIGLRIRSQTRAIFAALAFVVVWCAVPFVFGIILHEEAQVVRYYESPWNYLMLASPATIIGFGETSGLGKLNGTPALAAVMNVVIYGGILILVRSWCLRTVARQLGRAELPDGPRPGTQRRQLGFRGLDRPPVAAPR